MHTLGVLLALLALGVLTASAHAAGPVQLLPPRLDGGIYVNEETTQIGEPLTCLPGSWQSDSPMSITIQWLHGTAVVGTGETYHLQAADLSGGVACSVTATNADGSVSATVPIVSSISDGGPGTGVALPTTSIVSTDRRGSITVPLRCEIDSPCTVSLSLWIGKRIVAITPAQLDANSHARVVLRLTRYGLATLHAHPLSQGFLSVRTALGEGRTGQPVAVDAHLLGSHA
jgi:hypothetical protein